MVARYSSLFPALTISLIGFSQGMWVEQDPFPGQARWGTASFVIGDVGYMVGGRTTAGADLAHTYAYDPNTGTWTQKADIPGTRRMASAFTINGKGYVSCGAYSSASHRNDLWEYDPIANTWTAKASIPGATRYAAAGFSIDGIGYIVSGNTGSAFGPYSSELWAYDPGSNSWQARAPLPAQPRYAAEAFVAAGKAYVLGGLQDDQSFSNELWMYDPLENEWTEVTAIPSAPRGLSFTWDLGERGLICGGNSDDGPVYDCWMYHAQQDEWTPVVDYPGAGARAGVGFLIGGRIFAGFGLSTTTEANNDLWELTDLTTDVITTRGPREFNIYPNPTVSRGQLMIDTGTQLPGNAEFRLHNGLGQVVQRSMLSTSHGIISISLPDLSPGVYTVAILVDGVVTHATRSIVH